MCSLFCELLRNIVDMHAPIKTKNIRHNNAPYMNSEIRKWQYKRNMLRNVKKNKKKTNKIMTFIEKHETNVRV